MLPGHFDSRENLREFPGESLIRNHRIKRLDHLRVKLLRIAVDGEHTGCLAHSQHFLAGQLPVYVSCQSGKKRHILHMLLAL